MAEKVLSRNVYFSLGLRSILFLFSGILIVTIFTLNGSDHPFIDAQKWWPFQAIAANILTFFVIRGFLKREKLPYKSMFYSKKVTLSKNVKEYILLLFAGVLGGAIPLYLFSYVLLGSIIPPDTHFQPLPIGAAIVALILFPITNAMVETPTYLGYSLPRLQKIMKGTHIPVLFVGTALAFQHIFLPIVLEPSYMLWRLFSFLPLALILGYIFIKTKRLWPIVVVHFLMDLQLVFQMFIQSLK